MSGNTVELTLEGHDKNASKVMTGASDAVRSLIAQVVAMAGVTGAGIGLGALVKQGIDFNKTMEDSKGGLAGVLLMTRQYADLAGKVVTGQEAMNAAFAEASGLQEKLKKDALGTAASYTELVQAFQSSVGPATKAGVESLDDIREITVMATQAMSALGIPTAQAAQELRGLFAGDMGPDNRLNQVLGVTKAELNAVAGDAEAVAKLFKDRLGPAAATAAMQTGTLTVRMSNLGDILDQTMGEATAGLFKEISGLVAEMTAGIEENKGALVDLGETIGAAYDVVKETFADVAGTIGASARNAGLTWRDTFLGIATVFLGVVETIGSGVKAVTQYLTAPLETIWGAWKALIFGILSLFSELVAKFKDVPIVGDFFGAWSSNLDALVVSMTTVDEKFSRFAEKSEANFGDGALARTKAFLDGFGKAAAATGDAVEGLGSRAKKGLGEAAGAAYHFGQVWAAESAKATSAFQKFVGGFASFTGDTVGAAIAKIQDEYEDLVGQLGQMMFMAKVPFEKGLEMLERLAKAKGEKITAAIFNGEAAVEELISVFEAKLTRDDVFLGIKVAWAEAMEAIPTAAASAATAVQGVWQSMARTFDDAFYNVLSGRLNNLKDVFKNLWDSLLQTFSRYLSDLLQRWIKTQLEMSQTAYTGKAFTSTSYAADGTPTTFTGQGKASGGGPGFAGYLGAAGAGYGLGSGIGAGGVGNQVGGAVGAVGGLFAGTAITAALTAAGTIAAGAAIGSVIPIVGTIVGALIGAIIGGLFNKSTEMSVTGSIGGMVGATRWDYVEGRTNRRTGEEIPGFWRGTEEKATTAFEREGQKVFQSQAAMLADIFRVGAQGQASELLGAYQKTLKESLSGAWFKISAGSDEDIQKDAEILLSRLLPRIGLSAAFGQTGYLPHGDRDGKGGIPGINWGMPGMDEAGNWTGAKQLFDPEAPIPKMLAGLGFTNQAIEDLARRIAIDDPKKLLEYIGGIVGVVVGLRDLGTEMGKTFGELAKSWDDEVSAGPAVAIGKQAEALAAFFDELTLYSGDEQLAKAKEAQAASEQFWQSVTSYLQQLDALADKLSAGLQGMREKMRDFLNPLSEADAGAASQATIDGVWGKLLGATDAGQIEGATNEAAAAIEALFSVMAERMTRGTALLGRLNALIGDLGSLRTDVAFEQLEKSNPLAAWGQEMVRIQGRIADASRLSGLEQIAALEDVGASAEQMYANLKGFLADIANVSASINKSFDSQIWELGVGEMDASGQATAITDRIQELQEQLKLATSPAEISAITSEIQSLTGRYVGQFGKDDPNRAEAIAWAQQQLDDSRAIANAALDLLREQAEAFGDELEGLISGSVTTITTNVDEAAAAIGQLSHTLGALDTAVQEALERLGTSALDALGPLREAMDGAAGIFTGATGSAASSLTEPEAGFTASTDRAAARLDVFTSALDRAVTNLDRLANAGTGKSTAPTTANVTATATQSRVSSAEVIPMVRRYSGSLSPRVS